MDWRFRNGTIPILRPALAGRSPVFLGNKSRVGVVGGGPAGSFFSYFLLQFAERVNFRPSVDIYESKEFPAFGPRGCNMCGGVISESLIQALSLEGIDLPPDVVQRGINSFVLHTSSGRARMYAPFQEMRIAAVYRGGGPRGSGEAHWKSFDDYLLRLAKSRGANVIPHKVTALSWKEDRPEIHTSDGRQAYDLIVGAFGVNSLAGKFFENLGFGYRQPEARKTYNSELELGSEAVSRNLGSSMHAFLLNFPQLEFGALIPKGDYATLCLIGNRIDPSFVHFFKQHPAVKNLISDGLSAASGVCHCAPLASLRKKGKVYGNRVVLVGDCGISRLNKDGIGSAYRTAKAAAATAVFSGISAEDFRKHFGPFCRSIGHDNRFGRLVFLTVGILKRVPFLSRGIIRMTRMEQANMSAYRPMSRILWDVFTGSAPYREVFLRSLRPRFIAGYFWNTFMGLKDKGAMNLPAGKPPEVPAEKSSLGKVYKAGEDIIRQGETGHCMYVIQAGRAEVLARDGTSQEIQLAVLSKGDFFGEMAILQEEVRSATVRALGDVRVLVVDKRIFLRRVHEDPSFAFRIMEKMAHRIREMDRKLLHPEQSILPGQAGPGGEDRPLPSHGKSGICSKESRYADGYSEYPAKILRSV